MKQGRYTIQSNERIAENTYQIVLLGDTSAFTAPGQFANVQLDGFYLRRPLSIYDWQADCFTMIYKTVGKGTAYLSGLPCGAELDVLTGLGNGYDMSLCGQTPLLVGGGAGVPPLYGLAKRLKGLGKTPTAILGFQKKDEVFAVDAFEALGVNTLVYTADGSLGQKGLVTQGMEGLTYSYVYACGPHAMLKAVAEKSAVSGQFSFEERMGCGFGACMGCTCETKYGNKRICKDGPVLVKEEIIW